MVIGESSVQEFFVFAHIFEKSQNSIFRQRRSDLFFSYLYCKVLFKLLK